ncbi:MAG: glucose 1-dehydrogenase [Chloroflexi bacterium]|nr:glucose 1-dehydrogenase [Chloroflexota bacterium]
MRLKDKVVLMTGGTSGIGQAAAELFAAEGARVAFTGRRAERGEAVAAKIRESGGQTIFIPGDVTLPKDCELAIAETRRAFGRIDILFNNAGVVTSGTAEKTSEADWQLTMDTNVTAVWRMSRLIVPVMRAQGGGAIVNNASDWGIVGGRQAVAYCASKGAVVLMTKAMALDHARENIRINAVCPGDTFVERWNEQGYFRDSGGMGETLQALGEALPLGRVARAEEIARAVLFLASDESSFMTGAALLVDGGNTAN